jgi:hypothetical protein
LGITVFVQKIFNFNLKIKFKKLFTLTHNCLHKDRVQKKEKRKKKKKKRKKKKEKEKERKTRSNRALFPPDSCTRKLLAVRDEVRFTSSSSSAIAAMCGGCWSGNFFPIQFGSALVGFV